MIDAIYRFILPEQTYFISFAWNTKDGSGFNYLQLKVFGRFDIYQVAEFIKGHGKFKSVTIINYKRVTWREKILKVVV